MFFSADLETLGLHSLMVNRNQDLTSDIAADLRCNGEAHAFRMGLCFRGWFKSGPTSKQVPERGGFFFVSLSLEVFLLSRLASMVFSSNVGHLYTSSFLLAERAASPPQSIHLPYSFDTHGINVTPTQVSRWGGGDHTWRLHILHIQTLLQAFVLTCCAHPVRAAEMIREHAGGSPRSCCLSGESKKTGKCERVLSRSKKSRKVTASLARTGMEEKTQFVSWQIKAKQHWYLVWSQMKFLEASPAATDTEIHRIVPAFPLIGAWRGPAFD